MGLQLANMLNKSGELEIILYLTYYDDTFVAIVVERDFDEDEEALKKIS